MSIANTLINETRDLSAKLGQMSFSAPVAYVYSPLDYARSVHEEYLVRYADSPKKVIFLGMNPGPFGMAQTGVPFGEVDAVRDFLGLFGLVGKPLREHPGKPVEGFGCGRSEVSGRRLWGLFAKRFGSASAFFEKHYVHNFCPLLFLEDTKLGKNLTPEQLRTDELRQVNLLCDAFLRRLAVVLRPEVVVGVGGFAEKRAAEALSGMPIRVCKILHPSPASPAANKDWEGAATRALLESGIWE
ncbi:MAG: single-stranded DNA-binding protein [Puniceicoccales bacterium]|nr:single-stranded DNA-binding protein [Puniceicoccales bacterium]